MRFFCALVIALIIFLCVYFSFNKPAKTAAILAALAAAISFLGSYILDLEILDLGKDKLLFFSPVSSNSSDPDATDSERNPDKPDEPESSSSESESTPDLQLTIDKIASLSTEVQSIEDSIIENSNAQIYVYNGDLTIEDQVDTYSFIPSVTGRYRFEISGLTEGTGHKVNLVIKNSGNGIVDSTGYGIENNEGLTVKGMQAGETFQIQVEQYKGLDSYTLSIGNQKETLDVTGYTIVKDSVEFIDQRNVYRFTPPREGRYRFEIADLARGSDHKVNLLVFNSGGGEEASTNYGIMNGDGLTILGMQANQTYEIQVRQYSGYDSYSLNIGYQKESIDISGYNIVTDSVQYCDQRNVYLFTPAITGRYRFEISNLTKGSSNKVNLSVWNSRGGKEDSTSYGIMNGEGLTIENMQANEKYQIQVRQYSGYDMYSLNVGLQKETRDISKYNSVSDSIQYVDQQNTYTFTPSLSGKYRFEIQDLTNGSNNKVNVIILNSRGGEEGSTKYGLASGEWLEIADLQAGEQYEVWVQYYSGYDSYRLITTKVN